MRFSTAAFVASAAALVSAANVSVLVGDQGSLAFSPSSVTLNAGDTINFEFRAKSHSVTQSTFASPCTLQTTPAGIDSGFMPVAPNATSFPTWSITVQNASAPLWFFCAQTNPANHCHAGMVFAVNPTAAKTFDAFQAAAKAAGAASGSSSAGGGSTTGPYGYGSPSATTAASGTGAPASTSTSNSALRMGGSAAGILLAGTGLFAGLVL